MTNAATPVPDGYHTVTPYLTVQGVSKLIEFLQNAFGASLTGSMTQGDGSIRHAEVKIGDSVVMMGEASDQWKPMPACLYVYVADVDAVYSRALEAGATSLREPANQFYGDRSGGVVDSSGNQWWIATRVEEVSAEELARRAREAGH